MAYFISSRGRFIDEVVTALEKHFQSHANIEVSTGMSNGGKDITVHVVDGFDSKVDRLSEEEIKRHVMGGGFVQGLNGKTFSLTIEELDAK